MDRSLRADGLKVVVFRQTRAGNAWQDATPSPDTAHKLEDSILTRARELRLATSASRAKALSTALGLMARYNAKESERALAGRNGTRAPCSPRRPIPTSPRPMCWRCSPIRRGASIWAMCATTPWATSSPASAARRAYNVLHPMGWDAFGLPAENAARDKGVSPRDWTYENIAAMREQLKMMGLSLDWSTRVRHLRSGILSPAAEAVPGFLQGRFCLSQRSRCELGSGGHDRARQRAGDRRPRLAFGRDVERRKLSQWFFKITGFADELLQGLETLDRWPEKVRTMQKNWIGRSEGLRFQFALSNGSQKLDVFTTRPDTLFGASFVALSPEHPLAQELALKTDAKLASFIEECRHIGTAEADIEKAEKKGYDTGLTAAHPFDSDWKLPVMVANFVLMGYGTGAIFGCPAHDQRDLDFARKYS